ncbi:glucose-6-phosphate isomerase [Candidatus Litorirhabdus singularis]|nr:glucose-6-phosphate isomerase [Candidatus Litorirhabdus singularis]
MTTTDLPWPSNTALRAHAKRHEQLQVSELLSADRGRPADFHCHAAGIDLDYSRQLLDVPAREALIALVAETDLASAREAMFEGASINHTEQRAVLHTLLRAQTPPSGLTTEFAEIQQCLQDQQAWVDAVNSGQHRGFEDQPMTDIVNIGIGGSDLGPRMVVQALTPYHQQLQVHFCANIDPADLDTTLSTLNPATTLFIICSKTFSTEETLQNAAAARRWLLAAAPDPSAVAQHFLAVSTNLDAVAEFGIPADNVLPLWNWVGGRYSLWSAVGWSIAFAIGNAGFKQLLAGAQAMDEHFRNTPAADNMPIIMSLLELWSVNYQGGSNQAVIPYDHHLGRLPAFLQQLSMESNGKRVTNDGTTVGYATAPVLWGEEGSNGQHSFHQLLHQGTLLCPVDFILPLTSHSDDKDRHRRLVAHCIAQGQALTQGRDLQASEDSLIQRGTPQDEAKVLAPHLVIPGNRSCSTLTCQQLTPHALGALIALYEHKTFCSGHLWQINAFDQWGVELGKELSANVSEAMQGGTSSGALDTAAQALLERWQQP